MANRLRGVAGLRTVLGNNKRTKEALPQPVSDMYVATRSTQSLDDLLQDDAFGMKWSYGEDFSPDFEKLPTSLHNESVTNNNTSTGNIASTGSDLELFGSPEWKANAYSSPSVSDSLQATSAESEFSSFPGDDGDESFIPFEQTSVSKFGPISRLSKVKTNNSAPVQVTADTCKRMTPVLAVTPIERPLATSMQMPSRFPQAGLQTEPQVKALVTEKPSVWPQQSPQPSYHNIACLGGTLDAVTTSKRLAYELQAVELEIARKTGKEPEPVRKLLQEAMLASVHNGHHSVSDYGNPRASNLMAVLGHGHVTDCLNNFNSGEKMVSPQRAAETFLEDYYRSWQGIKM